MAFTKPQQGPYRILVEGAWQVHCSRNGLDPADKPARKEWYQTQLQISTNARSTTLLNRTTDYDKAMAHFERITRDGFDWQLAEEDGEARRIIYAVTSAVGNHNIDAAYISRVAQQAYGTTNLSELSTEQITKLKQMLIIDCRRRAGRGDNPNTTYRRRPRRPGPSSSPNHRSNPDNNPF